MKHYVVGVDLGGTNIKFGLVSAGEGIVYQTSLPTGAEEGPQYVIAQICKGIQLLLDAVPEESQIEAVGIGAPGAVSWDRTTVTAPPNFPGWDNLNLADAIRGGLEMDLPVVVENDANAAGLGSAFYGAGRPFDSFIMVTLGTGVGGAIIYQNEIFRGATGGAGELGHISVDYEGPLDRAGVAGAAEAYLGQRFLSRHARYQLLNRKDSVIHEMADEDLLNITPKMLHEAALAGDAGAQEVLAWAGHKLGVMLGSAINLLDIRKVIVGGGVSAAGDYILGPARDTMLRFVMPGLRDGVEIILETLGNEAGLLGAAHLAFQATTPS
ncbi:MAG TPA: ROK family protein [Rhodothermales bacterium]|nr:ROK family protein [Bacteroidota bacterium]HRK74953.1 ROK family protein [Rhodothermales bacterium]HRR07187.1 ROK family protein [Rhodothermales bacterium]